MQTHFSTHRAAMQLALHQAETALQEQETPVGAVIFHQGVCIAQAHNLCEQEHDATNHAELLAIRQACRSLGSARLHQCSIYITLEPCCQCAAALAHAQIGRVIFGAFDPQQGACGSAFQLLGGRLGWRAQIIGGIEKERCEALLHAHFARLRAR